MQLEPQSDFVIYRALANPSDTATYYVRATVYDAKTREVLDTLDLDSHTNQEYSKEWRTPHDPTGLGRSIAIMTRVYTDSGYTTFSDIYGQEEVTHLIKGSTIHGGGGGDVSYKKIRDIVKEEIEKIEMPQMEVDLSYIEKKLQELEDRYDNIKIDLSPVLDRLDKSIKKIKIPKPEKTNLKPLEKEVSMSRDEIITAIEKAKTKLEKERDTIIKESYKADETIKKIEDKINKLFNKWGDIKIRLSDATLKMESDEKEPEVKKFNFKRIVK
jgi:chaperonin cofactor prefoldin